MGRSSAELEVSLGTRRTICSTSKDCCWRRVSSPTPPRSPSPETLVGSVTEHGEVTRRPSGPGKKVLPLPRWVRGPIADQFMRWFVKDTAAYFLQPKTREKIRDRLRAQLPTGDKPFILVAHSQGTIVSFDVLIEERDRANVSLFVTLGSPLGIREVQDKIKAERGKEFELQVPVQVERWRNFADRFDPVAIDTKLANDFKPRGSVRVHDELILNKETLRANPHSAVGYLSHPAVRGAIHRALVFDSASRFVVARDVAETLELGDRQPVLIEVLEPGYWAVDESTAERDDRERKQGSALGTLTARIDRLAGVIEKQLVGNARGAKAEDIRDQARIVRLRKYVSARLTPAEIEWIAKSHAQMNVYAMWRSSAKRKCIYRSQVPLKADAARTSYGADGHGITWAVLDTGARSDHPHFSVDGVDTITEVLDCTTPADRPVPITDPLKADRDGHGTHVAGIIAGRGAFERERRRPLSCEGVAPRARLIVYKVLDDHGLGEDAWIIKAIDDVWRRNEEVTNFAIHGVNLSLGGTFRSHGVRLRIFADLQSTSRTVAPRRPGLRRRG